MTEDRKSTIEGTMQSAQGRGVVRLQSRYDSDIEDLWAALTTPQRIARWYGKVEGDLRLGGHFTAFVHGSQWEGRGHIDECDPPRRLRVTTSEEGGPEEAVTAELAADGSQTLLTIEVRGIPLDKVFAYAAGWHVHVEDLSGHLAGQDCADFGAAWLARWDGLAQSYRAIAVVPLEH
jgi:uncharacterized protein YndB with AHSA1/START domain